MIFHSLFFYILLWHPNNSSKQNIKIMALRYKRILLKLSGESLMGKQQFGIDPEMLRYYASQIKTDRRVVMAAGDMPHGVDA